MGVGTPEVRVAVDGPGADEEAGVERDGDVEDGGWGDGDAGCQGYGWVEAEDFVADGVEVVEGVERGLEVWWWCCVVCRRR